MIALILCFFSILSCKSSSSDYNIISIDTNTTYQTMEGFGASDAWRCQFVGDNWPELKKNRIAELLFSKEFDENGNILTTTTSKWDITNTAILSNKKLAVKNEYVVNRRDGARVSLRRHRTIF